MNKAIESMPVTSRIFRFPRLSLGNSMLWLAWLIVAVILLCAIAPGWIAPHDPFEQNIMLRLRPPVWAPRGVEGHLLGTDQLGRDVLSRIIYACRVTVLISAAAVIISCGIGLCVGLAAGYFGGVVDTVLVRVIDVLLAFPIILLVISVSAVFGASEAVLVLVMGLASWPQFARIVRAATMSVKALDFVDAARACGTRNGLILVRHILPNILSPVLVYATSEFSRMALTEATLSFLGLGVQPPTPSWGGMITEAQPYITLSWSASLAPGIVLALAIVALNTLGDAARDRLSPR